jgi:hypothetical protein
VPRTPPTSLNEQVKRAFSRALMFQIRGRGSQRRRDLIASGRLSRSHLQVLLKAQRGISLPKFIDVAEGLDMSSLELLYETLLHLERLRRADGDSTPKLPVPPSATSTMRAVCLHMTDALQEFAARRKLEVERGDEEPERAAFAIETYGRALAQALTLVAVVLHVPRPDCALDIDRLVADITRHRSRR